MIVYLSFFSTGWWDRISHFMSCSRLCPSSLGPQRWILSSLGSRNLCFHFYSSQLDIQPCHFTHLPLSDTSHHKIRYSSAQVLKLSRFRHLLSVLWNHLCSIGICHILCSGDKELHYWGSRTALYGRRTETEKRSWAAQKTWGYCYGIAGVGSESSSTVLGTSDRTTRGSLEKGM